MKKLLTLLTAVALVSISFASSFEPIKPTLRADQILIPINKAGDKISLLDLSTMKIKDVEQLTGRKMKFADRLAFKTAQNKLRNNINNDGTIDSKKLEKFSKRGDGESGFHGGGFALGLLLGAIGVIIAYIINDDKKHRRRVWAWIGWAVWIAIYLAFFL